MPTTRSAGSPQASRMTHTITSSGLVMVMTKASGQCFLIAAPTVDDHLGVGADQIVAAHPRPARDAGGDDHDIGAVDVGIVVGAFDDRVIALDRRALDDVERLALRHALDDVEQHDVAQFLEPGEQRDGAADLPGADQRDLVACHANASLFMGAGWRRGTGRLLPRILGAGKVMGWRRWSKIGKSATSSIVCRDMETYVRKQGLLRIPLSTNEADWPAPGVRRTAWPTRSAISRLRAGSSRPGTRRRAPPKRGRGQSGRRVSPRSRRSPRGRVR